VTCGPLAIGEADRTGRVRLRDLSVGDRAVILTFAAPICQANVLEVANLRALNVFGQNRLA